MAIESATQMAELTGLHASQIRRIVLADVHIPSALIVPDEDRGIEVLFNLHPTNLHSSRDRFLYEFSITSVSRPSDQDIFTQHGRGTVGLDIGDDCE